ncbi:MAG: hypothetical protein ACOYL6_01900 [Bacteriovoracaceae bacterium]
MQRFQYDKLFQEKTTKVAVIIEDQKIANEIATILKKNHSIEATLYDSLSVFWRDSFKTLPHLAIVDVKRMSDGDLLLKNHQKVKDGELKLAFFHTETTKILLSSTYGLANYGVVREGLDMQGQIKILMGRVEAETELKDQNIENEEAINRLKNRTARLVQDLSEYKAKEDRTNELLDLVDQLENRARTAPFMDSLLQLMSSWDKSLAFGLYELNGTSQKLIAPVKRMSKYTELPSLWLGSLAIAGISENARNMSVQVAIDQFGLDVQVVKIQGTKKFPDMLLYLSVEKSTKEEFNWELFSKMISGLYARSLALVQNKENAQHAEKTISAWELMNQVDEHHYNLKAAELRLVNLSFKRLVDGVKLKSKMRFFWKTFYNDFVIELEKACGNNYKLSEFGVYHFNFLVPAAELENFMKNLEDFVVRFSYWRYFEDSSASLSLSLLPEVKEVPLTSYTLMNHIDREFDDIDRAVSMAAKEAKRAFDQINISPRKGTFTAPRRELRDA